jgi:hypothetical protein
MQEVLGLGATVGPNLQRGHYMGAPGQDSLQHRPYIKATVGLTWNKTGVFGKKTPPVRLELISSPQMLMSSGECRPLSQIQFLKGDTLRSGQIKSQPG